MLSIRNVDPQGPDALALLHQASVEARSLYPELFSETSPPATNGPLPERGVHVVAYLHEAPCACGAIRPIDANTAELRRLYVVKAHRRSGLATSVLLHLQSEARRLGYSRLVLETGYKQVPAMQLYEANGFQRVQPFGDHANDPTSVCYELSLDRQA